MCRPATNPPTPGWGYGYGQGSINPTRTRTLLYPAAVPSRVQQPMTIPKKKQVVYYTDADTKPLWKCIPEFDDQTSTYADFKNTIMKFYPKAAEFLYSITDIDLLTHERQQL